MRKNGTSLLSVLSAFGGGYKDSQKSKTPLMSNFVVFSVTLFFIILVAGTTAFIFSMRQVIRTNKGSELAKLLEIERLKLETSVNSEISITLKMANSPLIKRFFANPGNPEMKEIVFEEIAAYRHAFTSKTIFWVSDTDKMFYFNDHDPYVVNPEDPENYWYPMSMYETEVYNFNINFNPDINVTNLWINAPVFDDSHRPIGIVGTGIDLSSFINAIYRNYTGMADIYFFNAGGEVTGAKNVEVVSQKAKINYLLKDAAIDITAYALSLAADQIITFNSPIGKIAVGTLPLLEWYSVAVLPDSIADYNSAMTLLFIVMLLVMALVFVIFNVFIAGLLPPLRKSIEEAETASRAKSAFLANMSHEIRTPMNSIVGFAELALDGEASPKTRDYLNKIHINSEWLLQIINDILDISKIESGKMEMENIPFDMHELFASCRTLIMPKAIEKGIQLHFYAEPSVGKKPLGDPTRLRQVLVNLLSNAIKFTKVGMVKLHAAVKDKTEQSITMHFEVKDSGIGMTEDQLEKIFDPFTQAESGTTRKYGGTGLGLPITKNIVELMGGKLSVESTPGVGSRFSFDLVFDTVDADDDDIPDSKVILDEIERPVFEGEVLLCEDNTMNQHVICEHLSRIGLKTIVADNGKIGVDMIRGRLLSGEKQFDLILMDMHMPVMDGLEASAKIIEFNANVPIIAMTANIMANDREIYKTSGMKDCIGKPFTSQELWRCLLKYLKPVSGGTVQSNAPEENTQTESVPQEKDIPVEKSRHFKENNLPQENYSPKDDCPLEEDLEFQKVIQKSFVKINTNKFEEIIGALEEDDIKLAHRLAHTLKSNAGQLGKTRLQAAAAEVESSLKTGVKLVTEEQLKLLEKELAAVLSELSPLLDEPSG